MTFYAHSGNQPDRSDWQLLPDHLDNTARLAAERAEPLGLAAAAALTGRYHDFGKYDPAFDRVLNDGNDRVDHSTAGAALLHARASGALRLVSEVLCYGGVGRNWPDSSTPVGYDTSPPARGRGSKPRRQVAKVPSRWGRPLRGGVGRNRAAAANAIDTSVAPCAGAWVETRQSLRNCGRLDVAPCAGAWVETKVPQVPSPRRKVAPCAGAWVETARRHHRHRRTCRPLRGGVGRNGRTTQTIGQAFTSPPARGRGSKRSPDSQTGPPPPVAPCAGAWVETVEAGEADALFVVAPCAGAWVETRQRTAACLLCSVAPCAGAWVETAAMSARCPTPPGRPLRGGVGRNASIVRGLADVDCRPLRGGVGRNRQSHAASCA